MPDCICDYAFLPSFVPQKPLATAQVQQRYRSAKMLIWTTFLKYKSMLHIDFCTLLGFRDAKGTQKRAARAKVSLPFFFGHKS